MTNAVLKVEGMSCNHCVQSVQGAVSKLPGVQDVKVSLSEQQVTVNFDEAAVSEAKIKEAIEDQGYDVK
jgi:copper chaperone